MNKTILCIAIAIASGVGSALAIPTTLGVDFRSAAWQSAFGQSSYSVGDVTDPAVFTWESIGGTEDLGLGTYKTNIDALAAQEENAALNGSGSVNTWDVTFWSGGPEPTGMYNVSVVASPEGSWSAYPDSSIAYSTPGIGVNVPWFWGLADILNTTFSIGFGKNLTGVGVTNLFSGKLEMGKLMLDTTQGIQDSGLQTHSQYPLGQVYINFGGPYNAPSAKFFEGGIGSKPDSVGGFTSSSVPDGTSSSVPDGGTTLALLGMGLISLTVLRRGFVL